jgi:sugar-specific transcriptional regulator TrmB
MDFIELLMNFNLTRQEAIIYKLLYAEGEMSGYEVAKKTGISRSNAYTSLASLVDKGAAYTIEGRVTLYTPAILKEYCDNKIKTLKELEQKLIEKLPKQKEEYEGYITIKGSENIENKIREMIRDAKERIYLSVSNYVLNMFLGEIEKKIKEGIKLVIITDDDIKIKGAKLYFKEKPKHQIRIIIDSHNVITGDIEKGKDASCLYSKKDNLVEVFKESLKNEIKLLEIEKGQNKQ